MDNEPITNSTNKVLVKVKAFSVNPLDLEVSRGDLDKFLRLGRKGTMSKVFDWEKTLAAKS